MMYKTILAASAVLVPGSGSAAVAQYYAPEYRAPAAQPGFVITGERYRSVSGTEAGLAASRHPGRPPARRHQRLLTRLGAQIMRPASGPAARFCEYSGPHPEEPCEARRLEGPSVAMVRDASLRAAPHH